MNIHTDLPREVLDNLDPVKKFELEALAKIANRLEKVNEIASRLERVEQRL
ncbi:hypothetical protein [Corynebacterium comes]|uniref:Uncharacterized protein n=1 Tax=Corynebacterium comes TaxID=2675218 RepID=A0A6B8W166_9CORY|nr:hypothetical protein [Corynebacterium comes]QGU05125.1 hypothetical protein CETAM_09370 [Corynebacterium comes]